MPPLDKRTVQKTDKLEPDYGTGALNKRKKTVFTAWPDKDFKPTEVIEVKAEPVKNQRRAPLWRVLLHLAGHQVTTIGMDIWRVVVLGRADPTSNFRPDLDFSSQSAMRLGVSRRHALIRPEMSSLWLIDQNSTNGTWINGKRLRPGRQHLLNDGDRVELGDLKFTVRVMNSPMELTGQNKR
jgi:hypothetical protein